MSKKSIPRRDMKILWGRSSYKCAICRTNLIEEKRENNQYIIGEMAHIKGENLNSARYDPHMTDEERNGYDNLILLCPTCHAKIDADPQTYTVEILKQKKTEHEKWVEESLRENIPEITFAELAVIIKYLHKAPILEKENYVTIIPPKDKISRNNLSQGTENLITIGMLQMKLIERYLNENPDIQFAERLRAGFVSKYEELKSGGLEGDALFYEMWDFASNYSTDFRIKAAGLSVLTYFFELCEVFEK